MVMNNEPNYCATHSLDPYLLQLNVSLKVNLQRKKYRNVKPSRKCFGQEGTIYFVGFMLNDYKRTCVASVISSTFSLSFSFHNKIVQ